MAQLSPVIKLQIVLLLTVGFFPMDVAAAQQPASSFLNIPETVSPQWQQLLRTFNDPVLIPAFPDHDDVDGWRQIQEAADVDMIKLGEDIVRRTEVSIVSRKIVGVPVLDIKPLNWQDDGKLVVYTHGGAYVFYSAQSTLLSSALFASSTGRRVISIDYTLAPHAKWNKITDQVLAVFKGLQEEGHSLSGMAIYGESAGGGLAAGAVLKMRDLGIGMPAAVVLWSPWSDITETGDTYTSLQRQETSFLYSAHLKPAADAYAMPQDQKHPYVSPVYGDYSRGFPPTLIQGGTKEIFLSNFIRHYQALDIAGQTVKLDLYEGMPHVFQPFLPDSPESKTALKKVEAFLEQYLDD